MTEYRCSFCAEPLDPSDASNYRRVVGWGIRGKRKTGGGSATDDIYLRELRDEWAHMACVNLRRVGVNPDQTSLL